MKKKLLVVGAVALAGVLGVMAGCSNKTRNLASLASNWYYDADFKRIQPTFTEEAAERLTYKVSQTKESTNAQYSVEYSEGTYTTEFYAKAVTEAELTDITLENWRSDYVKALGSKGMYLYYYHTVLSIPSVKYIYGDKSAEFDGQRVETESYFLSVEDYLCPVYSMRTVKQELPANLQASSLEDTYRSVDMVYENFYSLYGNSVMSHITDNLAKGEKNSEYGIKGLNSYANSVFDVAYLDIAVRAIKNISGSFSQTVGIYTPGIPVRDYTISNSGKSLFEGDDAESQLAEVQALLEDKGLFTPEPVDKDDSSKGMTTLKTNSASVAYNGGNYSGVSQTYWFAVSSGSNTTRTLMVKYSEPLHYNLGTLDYVLTSIDNIKTN